MTAWTLFVQFLIDYLAYFIIAGVVVVGLIVANVVWAVIAHKKKKQNKTEVGNTEKTSE